MQIAGLSQCISRKKMINLGMKRNDFVLTYSITTNYKHCSYLAYLRPTLQLVVLKRVMKGTL